MGLFIGLIIVGAIIMFGSKMFGSFLQGTLGKVAVSAVIVSIGALIIDKAIFGHIILTFIAKCGLALAIVLVVAQLIMNIFKK